jgi:hypothetical protein
VAVPKRARLHRLLDVSSVAGGVCFRGVRCHCLGRNWCSCYWSGSLFLSLSVCVWTDAARVARFCIYRGFGSYRTLVLTHSMLRIG